MKEVGRPTDLTEDVFDKIKQFVLAGKNLKEIASLIGKSDEVFYQWHSKNYSGLADKIEGWKRDRLINLAEDNVKAILALGISDKDTVKVVQDTSKFVLETLKKEQYSKKQETDITSNGETINKVLVEFVTDEFKNNKDTGRISTTV